MTSDRQREGFPPSIPIRWDPTRAPHHDARARAHHSPVHPCAGSCLCARARACLCARSVNGARPPLHVRSQFEVVVRQRRRLGGAGGSLAPALLLQRQGVALRGTSAGGSERGGRERGGRRCVRGRQGRGRWQWRGAASTPLGCAGRWAVHARPARLSLGGGPPQSRTATMNLYASEPGCCSSFFCADCARGRGQGGARAQGVWCADTGGGARRAARRRTRRAGRAPRAWARARAPREPRQHHPVHSVVRAHLQQLRQVLLVRHPAPDALAVAPHAHRVAVDDLLVREARRRGDDGRRRRQHQRPRDARRDGQQAHGGETPDDGRRRRTAAAAAARARALRQAPVGGKPRGASAAGRSSCRNGR